MQRLPTLGMLVLLILGCEDKAPAKVSSSTPEARDLGSTSTPRETTPQATWFTCASASDCTLITNGCCDRCNGGKLYTVNTRHEDALRATLPQQNCKTLLCTQRYCPPVEATCEEGRCGFAKAPPEAWFSCASDADCALVTSGCCDPCNGGKLHSVNTRFTAKLELMLPRPECRGVACTQRACPPSRAVCRSGRCEHDQEME